MNIQKQIRIFFLLALAFLWGLFGVNAAIAGEYLESACEYVGDHVPDSIQDAYGFLIENTTPEERKPLELALAFGFGAFKKPADAAKIALKLKKLNLPDTGPIDAETIGRATALKAAASPLMLEKGKLKGLKNFTLKHHEGGEHRGHAIERHVAKDKEYLKSRGIPDASSYPDLETADAVTQTILKKNEKAIAEWFNDPASDPKKVLTGNFEQPIGYNLKRGEDVLQPRYDARVVLKKMPNGEMKVLTSYPKE